MENVAHYSDGHGDEVEDVAAGPQPLSCPSAAGGYCVGSDYGKSTERH